MDDLRRLTESGVSDLDNSNRINKTQPLIADPLGESADVVPTVKELEDKKKKEAAAGKSDEKPKVPHLKLQLGPKKPAVKEEEEKKELPALNKDAVSLPVPTLLTVQSLQESIKKGITDIVLAFKRPDSALVKLQRAKTMGEKKIQSDHFLSFKTQQAFKTVTHLTDHYTLVEELGSGAFGSVHLAKHKKSDVPCAVKVIRKKSL